MLKLWLVVRIVGEVAASVGPVTVDMTECQAWARDAQVAFTDPSVKPEDVTVTCEWSALQPGVR